MSIKQKLLQFTFAALLVLGGAIALTSPVLAADCVDSATTNCCGGVTTSIVGCPQPGGEDSSVEGSGIWGILLLAINILTGLIAVAAVGGVVYGAILYTSAGGSQEQVKKAMGIITNVVIGVITYALMYSVSNFLIPGGIFS